MAIVTIEGYDFIFQLSLLRSLVMSRERLVRHVFELSTLSPEITNGVEGNVLFTTREAFQLSLLRSPSIWHSWGGYAGPGTFNSLS